MSVTQAEAEGQARQHDGQYYLTDDHLIFLVEDTLFRVHAHFLVTHSPIFADMLSCPTSDGAKPEGGSDENLIALEGVKAADFKRLLWVFYNNQIDTYAASAETWYSILALAHKWEMRTIQDLAIRKLGSLPLKPVEKLCACARYDIDRNWALDALLALCARNDAVSVAEGHQLGLEMSVQIAQAREEISKLRLKTAQPSVPQEDSIPAGAFFGGPRRTPSNSFTIGPPHRTGFGTRPDLDTFRSTPTTDEISKVVKKIFNIK